jgi:diaminobutyrate-2-oxoglutarate transaminase
MDFKEFHLSESPCIYSNELPGPLTKKLLDLQELFESNNRYYPKQYPLSIHRAKGVTIEDEDGNLFFDFFSSCGVLNLGHNNPVIVNEIANQLQLAVHSLDFPSKVKMEFMTNLNAILPENLKNKVKFNFCGPTGTNANEAALKLAKINTKRKDIYAFQGSFHGMTSGSLSVSSNRLIKKDIYLNSNSSHFFPYAHCYRCALNKSPENCKLECANLLRVSLENPHSGIEIPAAIIIEPIQAEAGVIVPRQGFLEEIVKIAHEFNVLVIFDEIQAGFFRTGKLFSFENSEATPDIITLSKGIGGIGMPISLVIMKKELDTWKSGTHTGTFRGNLLSIAAGNSAIKFIQDYNIREYIKDMGDYIKSGLIDISRRSKFIGEVRGLGLFYGIEFVSDKESKKAFPDFTSALINTCFKNGIILEKGGYYSNVIRIMPPLIITRKIADNFLQIFAKCYDEIERRYL